MIQINLLEITAEKTQTRERVDPTKPLLYAAFVVLVGATVMLNVNFALKLSAIEKTNTRLQTTMNSPEFIAQVEKAEALQAELDKLETKKLIVEDLIVNRIHWSKKLAAMRDVMPADIWVEKISLENPTGRDEVNQILQIDAATVHTQRSFARTAETMDALKESEDFMDGFIGEPVGTVGAQESWGKSDKEGPGAQEIWRFSIQLQRPLPESELPN